LWQWKSENKAISPLLGLCFYASFGVYLFSVLSFDAELSFKAQTFFRDLIVISGLPFIFSIFHKNLKSSFIGALVVLGGIFTYVSNFIAHPNSLKKTSPSVLSDPHAKIAADGELLVDIRNTEDWDALEELAGVNGLAVRKAFQVADKQSNLNEYYILDIPKDSKVSLASLQSLLSRTDFVDYFETNEVINVAPFKGSPITATERKFGLNDPGVSQQWAFETLKMNELYDYLDKQKIKPSRKALVAVLDTGVDAKHSDLAQNYRSLGLREANDKDSQGHGTHCAGTIGAVSNNGIGIASFSRNNEFVEVTSVQALPFFGMGTQAQIIQAMLDAIDNGADVLNMSLGGPSSDEKLAAYSEVVAYANSKNVIVVCAAGNENQPATNVTPANIDGVITVSAITRNATMPSFANDVSNIQNAFAAPGTAIYSTKPQNKYTTHDGTSMAAPFVSGLVGMMKSINPDLTVDEVAHILKATSIDTKDTARSGLLIQPAKAIKMVVEEKQRGWQ